MIGLAWRLARRDLKGARAGFAILLACLALGVAAIAAAGSLDASLRRALTDDAQALLGGDVALRLAYRPPDAAETAFLAGFGTLSQAAEMRAMARADDGAQTLVEVKGVDDAYPLYGAVTLAPAQPLGAALDRTGGAWGAAVDAGLLDRLGLKVGDALHLGAARLVVRAVLVREPDRIATAFALGPRLMVDSRALADTGLVQPGSLIHYALLVRLKPGVGVPAFKAAVAARFPHAGWLVRDSADAAPGVKRFLERTTLFLSLVGLTALLVGGIGVANGVRAFLDTRVATIAILKSVGASRRLIVVLYGLEVAVLAGTGIALGLAVGAATPALVAALGGSVLPIRVAVGVYPAPLALAGAFGALTTLAFAAWPLAQAGRVPASLLFRDVAQPVRVRPGASALAVIGLAALALAALAVATAPEPRLAAMFVAGALAAFALFGGLGTALLRLARAAARHPPRRGRSVAWSLALSSLHRPGAPTRGVVLSLGLGLTVLVTVALVQANLARQFSERIPAEAPTFFFIDIQPGERDAFAAAVARGGGRVAASAPMVRGRITRLDGRPVETAAIAPDAEWAVRGDRGLTSAATPPEGTRIVAGTWWPADYDGPPLVSLDAGIAKGFGLKPGQTITVNVLGREITATIASLREIDWTTLSMNFTFILSPNALAGAPKTYIATVFAPSGGEGGVERAVAAALPAVSQIRVKEALETARGVIRDAALAISAAAAVALAAGALVLAGAVAAGRERRIRETVLMKVLGARRADLLRALALEYALLGVATGGLAVVLGGLAAYGVLVFVLGADWVFLPLPLAGGLAAALTLAVGIGVAGTARALTAAAAPYLRHV